MSCFLSSIVLASVLSRALAAPLVARSDSYGQSSYGSSMDNSSMDKSSSDYNNDSSSYGDNSGSYGSGSQYGSDSYTTSTWAAEATSTWSAAVETASAAYGSSYSSSYSSSPMYGSGSMSWGGSGYSGCVQQCMASYGPPPSTYVPPASSSYSSSSNSTNSDGYTPTSTSTSASTTHTIIVAPTKGVLRYVPAFVNASVGDTVRWIWGAGPHTVTKSSILTPCNKSSDAPFASGAQNASFVFDQQINDTDTTFFYCGIPTHCEKGMFGIINPPVAPSGSGGSSSSSNTTVGSWVMSQAASDASMSALYSYVQNQTMGTSAYGWGMDVDMSTIPSDSYVDVAQNAMYTALFYAANPGMLEAGQGASNVSPNGINVPADISAIMANLATTSPAGTDNAASTSSSSDAGAYGAAPATTSASASSSGIPKTGSSLSNGSGRLASSTVLVGLAAVAASLLAL